MEEIDRVIASGSRFGCVLADAGYGSSSAFRQALSERGLLWAVGLSRRQTYTGPMLIWSSRWRTAAGAVNITYQTSHRSRPRRCCLARNGTR
ncbi:transposase [Brucella intermedia]|uniref:transposase n=1 Tax=Brucella intermedia TaxID=94625 RepID=UPI00399D73E2